MRWAVRLCIAPSEGRATRAQSLRCSDTGNATGGGGGARVYLRWAPSALAGHVAEALLS